MNQQATFTFGLLNLIVVVLVCLAIIGYLIFRLYKATKRNKLAELKYNELENKYNQIELENLDSRLNPHLFKNILNSILNKVKFYKKI